MHAVLPTFTDVVVKATDVAADDDPAPVRESDPAARTTATGAASRRRGTRRKRMGTTFQSG